MWERGLDRCKRQNDNGERPTEKVHRTSNRVCVSCTLALHNVRLVHVCRTNDRLRNVRFYMNITFTLYNTPDSCVHQHNIRWNMHMHDLFRASSARHSNSTVRNSVETQSCFYFINHFIVVLLGILAFYCQQMHVLIECLSHRNDKFPSYSIP